VSKKFLNFNYIKKYAADSILYIAIFLGAGFRFLNLNWDGGHAFHPDEKNIARIVTNIHFPYHLDPFFYTYNGFSIYLVRIGCEIMKLITGDYLWVSEAGHITLVGRYISAIAATFSILVFYNIVKVLLKDKAFAAIGALLFSLCVGLIQYAHYAVTESLLVLLLLILVFLSIRILQNNFLSLKYWSLFGLTFGLALGTKTSAAMFIVIPILTLLISICKTGKKDALRIGFSFVGVTLLSFLIVSPYTLISFNSFLTAYFYENSVVSGTLKVIYTVQFEKTLPYLFFLKNFFWQMGLIWIPAVFAYFAWVIYIVKKKEYTEIIPTLTFVMVYFLYVGQWFTKFIRYMLPIIPFLILSLVWFCFILYKKYNLKTLAKGIVIFSILMSGLWTTMYMSVYTQEHTRIQASKWMYENIPEKSTVIVEYRDQYMPALLDNKPQDYYKMIKINVYGDDSREKAEEMAKQLASSDYLVFATRRVYATVGVHPEIYPNSARYFQLMLHEELGYVKEKEFAVYPHLFGITINDDASEETFQVYDHPKVMIFKNNGKFSQEQLTKMILGE
jgi:hypothetical protein